MDKDSEIPMKTERDSSLARQRSQSSSRGSERARSEMPADGHRPRRPHPARPHYPAPPPLPAGGAPPGPRTAPPNRRLRIALTVTPHRTQHETAAARTTVPVQTPQPPPQAKRPVGSPKSNLESDFIIASHLVKANLISEELVQAIAMSLNDRQRQLDEAGVSTPDEEEMTAVCSYAATVPVPETAPTATLKRQRTETDIRLSDTATKLQRVAAHDDPLP